ncbi:TolC family protein [Cupriavidus necator]|uniref:TolC family protein n=1 Tax=Cupriavidus necator TaxID=106590 RepID=A0A367PDI1_CUPNE|nr:TolC family protein [Cupriavidus necator]QQX87702.1 TolC family protein [Cupriavidus necator]RCJ05932.1 TolC family protein [Cupriavidus necator]
MLKLERLAASVLAAAAAVVAGCTSPVGPQSSGVDVAPRWQTLAPAQANADLIVSHDDAQVDQQWWSHFHDAALEALIREAIAGNKSLGIARARVEEARAGRLQAQSALAPEVNAVASSERGNRGLLTNDKSVTVNQVALSAAWELDLFGRNQARTAQATAILQSTEAGEQAVRVALLAEVARTYFELRNLDRQIELTASNLETQRRTLKLVEAQQRGALVSNLDVQRAAAQTSTTESRLPSLRAARDAAANRLSTLLGRTPGTLQEVAAAPQPPLDGRIVVSAPASVIATRPDVRVAERRFAASISARKAAVAELFPNISLTALFGVQDATPFSSTPWGIGIGLVQPVLNFGRIRSQIDAADARQTQAFLAYQQTVLDALEDMESAMSAYLNEQSRNTSLAAGVAQNRRAAELARAQYRFGYVGLLDVLVAERDLLDAESQRATSDASLRTNLVRIFAAAGGGWEVEEDAH